MPVRPSRPPASASSSLRARATAAGARATAPTVWCVGGEDVRLRLPFLHKLRERGFRVAAVGSEEGTVFAEHDIPYHHYPLQRWINPWADRAARQRLVELFCEHRPDVVHAFDTKPAILAPLAGRQAGVPVRVRTVNGMGYVFSSSSPLALSLRPVYRHLQSKASRSVQMTVFQNRDDQSYFRRHALVAPRHDALVVGSGIDVDQFLLRCPSPTAAHHLRRELDVGARPVFTMISRLVRHKGVLEFLRAADLVRRRGVDALFLLVGPLESEGRQAVTAAELHRYRHAVHCLGRRDDVPAILAISDAFVLPTYYREGVPRVLLEAGVMGLPLIATDMPGCRDVVRHETNGLLIEPRNATALADAIERLAGSPELRRAMGRYNREHIQHEFGLDRVTDAYADIYLRLLHDQANTAGDQRRQAA